MSLPRDEAVAVAEVLEANRDDLADFVSRYLADSQLDYEDAENIVFRDREFIQALTQAIDLLRK